MLTRDNAPDQPESIAADDPRWSFAMRARLVIERQPLNTRAMDRLMESAARIGLSPMQAEAIVGIVEDAFNRGGIDRIAHDQIMALPENTDTNADGLSERARWMTFGMLFAWALMVAGIMQVVA